MKSAGQFSVGASITGGASMIGGTSIVMVSPGGGCAPEPSPRPGDLKQPRKHRMTGQRTIILIHAHRPTKYQAVFEKPPMPHRARCAAVTTSYFTSTRARLKCALPPLVTRFGATISPQVPLIVAMSDAIVRRM